MSPIRFTILVAVYNAEAWLPQCLDSLLGQTEASLEVICIDDCSTDGSVALLEDYARRDARVTVMHTPVNSGQAVARNLGLTRARGVLTTMVDADDWLAPDALEQAWRAYSAADDIDAVAFRLIYTEGGRTWLHAPSEALGTAGTTLSGTEACRMSIDWHLHGYYAIRTDLHRRWPYDTTCRLYSDDNTSRQHYLHCRRVAVNAGDYHYRQHPAASTRQTTRRRFDFLTANDALRRMLEDEKVAPTHLAVCEDYVWRQYVGLWRERRRPCRLTPDEEREVDGMLRDCYGRICVGRLPWRTRLRPCYFAGLPYGLFCLWQRLLMLRHHA